MGHVPVVNNVVILHLQFFPTYSLHISSLHSHDTQDSAILNFHRHQSEPTCSSDRWLASFHADHSSQCILKISRELSYCGRDRSEISIIIPSHPVWDFSWVGNSKYSQSAWAPVYQATMISVVATRTLTLMSLSSIFLLYDLDNLRCLRSTGFISSEPGSLKAISGSRIKQMLEWSGIGLSSFFIVNWTDS